jgi:hypothetical protein
MLFWIYMDRGMDRKKEDSLLGARGDDLRDGLERLDIVLEADGELGSDAGKTRGWW